MFIESFERTDERATILKYHTNAIVHNLHEFIVFSYWHFCCCPNIIINKNNKPASRNHQLEIHQV